MSEIQLCEGIWRNRVGRRMAITQCDPDNGQQWTDGDQRYSDSGSFFGCYGGESEEDLVQYLGPLPNADQTAEIERLNTVLGEQADVIDALKEDNKRLTEEALQAQRYVSDVNEKINQQTKTIEHLGDRVSTLENVNENLDSEIAYQRELRRTNEAIIKELRQLLTYALSKK